MRFKILSYVTILCLILTSISLISTKALHPQPRVDLDEYNINVTSNTAVYVEGTVSKSYGQQISVRDTSFIPIALGEVGNSGGKESFKIKIPAVYIKSGSNTFYVYSEAVRGKLARSNSKEFKVNYNTNKQTQTITASNKSVQIGKTVSLGAKASSGLPLTYKSSNPSIATVDMSGKVVGRKTGSAKITISQAGNSQYNAVSKTITITVAAAKKNQTITASNKSVTLGKTASLGAKASSKGKLTYKSSNPKVAAINSKGVITGKKVGKVTITIYQAGNSTYKAVTKKVTVTVKDDGIYTIVYHGGSDIGMSKVTGKMSVQRVRRGQTVALYMNRYKKQGYQFVGWTTSDGTASKNNSKHIEKFKNIHMEHFQLGSVKMIRKPQYQDNGVPWSKLKDSQKQYLLDRRPVKNIAGPGKTIHLYAVWKGDGPEAAVDWATIIAADNNFTYGAGQRAHKHGCYFCGTNRSGKKNAKKWNLKNNKLSAQSTAQKYDKTYCCNPFIGAAYKHGANHSTTSKCLKGNMDTSSWTRYNNSDGKFKKISKSTAAKPGDIYYNGVHVWMYVGNGKKIEASGGGWGKNSIRIKDGGKGSAKGVIRYYPGK